MLRLMRDHASSWLIKFLLGAIVIVFVFWGVGSFRAQRSARIARVNGEPITNEAYRQEYNQLIEQLRQNFGGRLTDDMLEMFQVKQQALNRLIDRRLMLQEAERLHFSVADRELAGAIQRMEVFQQAGVFNSRIYQSVLNRIRMTPEEFEIAQREAMLSEKLRNFITAHIKVSDQEALEWFNWQEAAVDIDYVCFESERYRDVAAGEEAVKTFFDQNRERYKTQPKRKARYLRFDLEAYRPQIQIDAEQIQEYYELHQEAFETPQQVEARHILRKLEPDAGAEAVEQQRQQALKIMALAREGGDFGQLAQEYSEGPTKAQGGYLGTFKRGTMVQPFEERAFEMAPGQISEPVRTRFGWHVIKVEKVHAASRLTLEEATAQIVEQLTDEGAKNLALDDAEAVYDDLFDAEDLVRVAQSRKLELVETDWFDRQGPMEGPADPKRLAALAFDLTLMEISEVQDFEDAYYLIQATAEMPAEIPDFETVREQVGADATLQLQKTKAREEAETFLAELKNGKTLQAAGAAFGVSPAATGFFKRNDTIPEVGLERDLTGQAFKLSPSKPLPDHVIEGQKGFYVIYLRERRQPAPEGFEAEKEQLKQRLLRQKQVQVFQTYLESLKERSEIVVEADFLGN